MTASASRQRSARASRRARRCGARGTAGGIVGRVAVGHCGAGSGERAASIQGRPRPETPGERSRRMTNPSFSLDGRKALVTGASRGIGASARGRTWRAAGRRRGGGGARAGRRWRRPRRRLPRPVARRVALPSTCATPAAIRARRRQGGAGARRARHPRQQRRRRGSARFARGRRGAVGPHRRYQPEGRLLLRPGGGARAWRRARAAPSSISAR